jgi:hypothetical protein
MGAMRNNLFCDQKGHSKYSSYLGRDLSLVERSILNVDLLIEVHF